MEQTAFLIIASARTGGTFLARCLSNHPDIYCERGEPLNQRIGIWKCCLPDTPTEHILFLLWQQYGYLASGCKATYKQFLQQPILALVENHKPHIIHLTRDNVVRQAASQLVLTANNNRTDKTPLIVVPGIDFVERCKQIVQARDEMRERLKALECQMIEVEYSQLVGGEGHQADQVTKFIAKSLCQFLNVPRLPLPSNTKLAIDRPLRAVFENWGEIEAVLQASEFAPMLENEAHWTMEDQGWVYK